MPYQGKYWAYGYYAIHPRPSWDAEFLDVQPNSALVASAHGAL